MAYAILQDSVFCDSRSLYNSKHESTFCILLAFVWVPSNFELHNSASSWPAVNLSLVARVRTGGKGILCGYTEDADGLKTKGLFVARGKRRRNLHVSPEMQLNRKQWPRRGERKNTISLHDSKWLDLETSEKFRPDLIGAKTLNSREVQYTKDVVKLFCPLLQLA